MKIRLFFSMKYDWSIPKKDNCNLKDNRFLVILEDNFFHTSCMPQIENTCKLHSKCLKKEESLEECNNPECLKTNSTKSCNLE